MELMKKLLRTITLAATGCLLLVGVIDAKPRSCRIVYPERPKGAPKMAHLFDGKDSHQITLPSMNLSPVIELPSGELTIAMTADVVSDPESLSPAAPRLRIPESVTDFYILVTPDPDNLHIPVKINLVDPGGEKLKPGETLWFNGTNHRIVGKLGEARLSVKPKARAISKDPVPTSGYYTAEFGYQANGEGAFAPITEQSWYHDARSRHLGFIVNTGGKLPRIYFFRDFRLPDSERVEADEGESE